MGLRLREIAAQGSGKTGILHRLQEMGKSIEIGLVEFQEARQHGLEEGQCGRRFQGRALQIEETTPTKTGPEQGGNGLAVELTQMQYQRLQRERGSVE